MFYGIGFKPCFFYYSRIPAIKTKLSLYFLVIVVLAATIELFRKYAPLSITERASNRQLDSIIMSFVGIDIVSVS